MPDTVNTQMLAAAFVFIVVIICCLHEVSLVRNMEAFIVLASRTQKGLVLRSLGEGKKESGVALEEHGANSMALGERVEGERGKNRQVRG